MGHIKSLFTDEQELLKAILDIHNKGNDIELDPMYNKGMFYKKLLNEPKYKFDIDHKYGVPIADARRIPLASRTINSIILDPPFLFNKWDKASNIIKRYSRYHDNDDLKRNYFDLISEASRLLKAKGLLIFKCQDLTTGGITYMTHIEIANVLTECGFYIKDLAILNKTNKISKNSTIQRHLRKTHTYFFVAIKKG